MAMLIDMLRRDRERWGMTKARAARRFRVSLRAYREIEAGERDPEFATYDAICKVFGWPQAFVSPGGRVSYR